MAFDASVVKCFVSEAEKTMINARIDKIHQPQKDELFLSLRAQNGNHKLFISANPSYPRIHLTTQKSENPAVPPMFCMLLRKHIGGGKITAVYQEGFERILTIEIESYDELGDLTTKKLVVEIMGKHSNIILLGQENKIIDSIKRIDISTSSVRQILPGLTYRFPPVQDKLCPLDTDFDDLSFTERELETEIMTKFYGISKLTAREVAYLSQTKPANDVLKEIFANVRNNEFSPCIIYDETGKPVDFSAHPILQFAPPYRIEYHASVSYIIEKFYFEKAMHFQISQHTAYLVKIVHNNMERCRKKLAIFHQQLIDAGKREQYKQYGDLIISNLYRISDASESLEAENYFEESCPIVTIALNPSLTPAKNAQKYYTKYNKAKNAEAQANIQIASCEKELEYLESVMDTLNRAESFADIREIKEELREVGYLAKEKDKGKKKTALSAPEQYDIASYTVYVGKNNRQNDVLTLKTARSQDIWLHTKNIPGAHVIIVKKPECEIPDNVILKAAKLAAAHSKAKNSAKVPVDYTQVKNVKKPSGAKPGMVIYDHYNTVYVTP